MSGLVLKYKNRAFWSKHLIDIWLYHMSHIILNSNNMPQWALDWAEKWFEYVPENLPDYSYYSCLDIVNEARLNLLVKISQQVLERLNDYDNFLETEKPKWLTEESLLQQIPKPEQLDMLDEWYHWKIMSDPTLKTIASLQTFASLFIKMLTGEGWYPAYFYSFADPRSVATIDYLEAIKPNGDVGNGIFTIADDRKRNGTYWISPQNHECQLEYDERYSYPKLIGIPDLLVNRRSLIDWEDDWPEEDKIDYDAFQLQEAQKHGINEEWWIDREKCVTLLISTEGQGSAIRYPAEADFYSPALSKTVNLKHLFDI